MKTAIPPSGVSDKIPTRAQCEELMAKYAMLPNIQAHSRQVMRVALAIADHLKSGLSVNRDLVLAGALLHDITKTRALHTRERHDQSGAELLRSHGFFRVGEIVRQHVIVTDFDPDGRLTESEIVNYADKRVMHDSVVTLAQRLEDLIQRYGVTEDVRRNIRNNGNQTLAVEKKIIHSMAVDLEIVLEKLSEAA